MILICLVPDRQSGISDGFGVLLRSFSVVRPQGFIHGPGAMAGAVAFSYPVDIIMGTCK